MPAISRTRIGAALALVAGCQAPAPLAGPDLPAPPAPAADIAAHETLRSAQAAPDVSGNWVFTEEISILQPSELNPVIGGPVVDAPMTRVHCSAEGTMTLDQDGETFEGTATQSVICRIGDVSFVPPEFAFNPVFFILNGRIQGSSIHFDTGHSLNTCPNRGSITRNGGAAVGLSAFGKCEVPFHPGEHHSWWAFSRP